MSLLNDYAATRAGAPASSFSVCGDDLVGLWTSANCDEYERIVTEDLHLVVNRKKSYRGDAGVFCEMFVTRKSCDDEAIATPYIRLGEASGVVALRGNNGHYVVDTLRDISLGRQSDRLGPTCGIIRALAGAAATRFAVSRKVPGPLRCGGGGVGVADELTAKVFLMGGAVSTRKLKKTVYEERGQKQRLELLRAYHKSQIGESFETNVALPTMSLLKVCNADRPGMNDPRLQQVMADAATTWNHTGELLYSQWAVRAKLRPATVHDHRKRLECRVRQAEPESWRKLLSSESVRERYSSDDRAAAFRHFKAGRFQKGIEYLRKHTRRISAEAAVAISGRSLLPASLRKSKPGGTYRDARA